MTPADRNLIMRAVRQLLDDAQLEANSHGQDWSASDESKKAKKRYDRLHRDARDLREYVARQRDSASDNPPTIP